MRKPKGLPPMDDIHQLVLKSIKQSDLFESDRVRDFVVVILDMFIHKCDGLEFFVNYYDVKDEDIELYFKEILNGLGREKNV